MSTLQALGRILFVVILLVRGAQHLHKPDDWTTQFKGKYEKYWDVTSKIPLVKENVPAKWLNLLHPQYINTYAVQYGKYIGYTELLLASTIILSVPGLPLVGGVFLLVENLVIFNPFHGDVGKELYYFISNMALVGIVFMMAFAPPLIKAEKIKRGLETVKAAAQQGATKVQQQVGKAQTAVKQATQSKKGK